MLPHKPLYEADKLPNRPLDYDEVDMLTDEQLLHILEEATERYSPMSVLSVHNVGMLAHVYIARHPEENSNPSERFRKALRRPPPKGKR